MRPLILLALLYGLLPLSGCGSSSDAPGAAGPNTGPEPCDPGSPGCASRCPPGEPNCMMNGGTPPTIGTGGRDVEILPKDSFLLYEEEIDFQSGDDVVTVRDPAVFIKGIRGGVGEDTFTWQGARISDDAEKLLDVSLVREFELIDLSPGGGESNKAHEMTVAELHTLLAGNPGVKDFNIGEGLTLQNPMGTETALDWSPYDFPLKVRGGFLNAKVDLGPEEDRIIFAMNGRLGPDGGIDGGEGVDTLEWDGTGSITGTSSGIENLEITSGNDQPIMLYEAVLLLDNTSPNRIELEGDVEFTSEAGRPVRTGAEDDVISFGKGSEISAEIRMGMGEDRLEVLDDGRMSGMVYMGEGADVLEVRKGAIFSGGWDGGDGNDEFISGPFSEIRSGAVLDGGEGEDTLLDGGEGEDTFVWQGGILGMGFVSTDTLISLADGIVTANIENLTVLWTDSEIGDVNVFVKFSDLALLFDPALANRLVFDVGMSVGSSRCRQIGIACLTFPVDTTAETAAADSLLDLGPGNDIIELRKPLPFALLLREGVPTYRQTRINGGEGDDTFVLKSGVLLAFTQTVHTEGGIFLYGGEGTDTISLPSDHGLDMDAINARIEGIETISSVGSLAVSSLDFETISLRSGVEESLVRLKPGGTFGIPGGQVVFSVGRHHASRLVLEGDMAAGLQLVVERDYSPYATDLSVGRALSVAGRMDGLQADGTAGLSCTHRQRTVCDLLLYDRAVPAALAAASALESLAREPAERYQPVSHTAVTSRVLRYDAAAAGVVDWRLSALTRVQSDASGLQTQWSLRRKEFSLRIAAHTLHMNWSTQISGEQGLHWLDGRLTGAGGAVSALWQMPGGATVFAVAADIGYFAGDSLQLYQRPVTAELTAGQVQVYLGAGRRLATGRQKDIRVYAELSRREGNVLLSGLDRLDVAVSPVGDWQGRIGLTGEHGAGGQTGRLSVHWSADWLRRHGRLQARVLNTDSADVLGWRSARDRLQWRLGTALSLGQWGTVRLAAERTDFFGSPEAGSLGATSVPETERDYRLRLSLQAPF